MTFNTTDPQYKVLSLVKFSVKINNDADCYILTNDNTVIKVLNIAHLKCSKDTIIIGKPFSVAKNMFEKPIKIIKIRHIYCWTVIRLVKSYCTFRNKKKVMLFPMNEIAFMASPILHSDPSSKDLWLVKNKCKFSILYINSVYQILIYRRYLYISNPESYSIPSST